MGPGEVAPVITRHVGDAVMKEAVEGILWILDASRSTEGAERLRAHLGQSVQMLSLRCAGASPAPEKRDHLTATERHLASSLDGVVEIPEAGRSNRFFDAKGRRFYRL